MRKKILLLVITLFPCLLHAQQSQADLERTWQDFNVVSMGDIGGDYWEDIKFHIGYKHQHWMTSRGGGVLGSNNDAGRATGTLTSEPFKLYPRQNFGNYAG